MTDAITFLPPPRATNNASADAFALNRWTHEFFELAFTQGGLVTSETLAQQLEDQYPILFNLGSVTDSAADKLPYFSGVNTWSLADFTSTARGLVAKTTVADMLTYLGITLLTAEQAMDVIAGMIQNGTGLTWTYNDGANTLTGDVSLLGFSTTQLAEGLNLYFTNERVDDRVAVLIQNGTGISWFYNDGANTLTPTISLASFSTTNLSEGANLYYTDERVDDRVAALLVAGTGISLSYNDGANTLTISESTTLASGVYTPTLTNVVNLDASTAYQCQYMRVGSVVTVSGRIDLDPTTSGVDTQVGITLPIASNFGAIEDCGGTAAAVGVQQAGAIMADSTNDRALLEFTAATNANKQMNFSFTYRII